MGCIYLVINKVNGKMYVGKTIHSLAHRWRRHCTPHKIGHSIIDAAIVKYGETAFTVVVLEESDDAIYLNTREMFYIVQLETRAPIGYNLTAGGDGGVNNKARTGKPHTEETKQKMRESSRVWHSKPENAAKMREVGKANCRLSETDAQVVRQEYTKGTSSINSMAARYHVSRGVIERILGIRRRKGT